jgi:hypothetical protein
MLRKEKRPPEGSLQVDDLCCRSVALETSRAEEKREAPKKARSRDGSYKLPHHVDPWSAGPKRRARTSFCAAYRELKA